MRQYRGCSRLYYALVTEDPTTGVATYGTPKQLAPVKSVSRDISGDNEKVFADNVLQQETYGATTITRTFETTRIDAEVIAELMGSDITTIGSGTSAKKLFGTKPDGSSRPYVAIGYALHDGDVDNPCELVWAFKGKVNSISKSSATIDDGTGSEGQSVEIQFVAPKVAFTATSKRDLDISLQLDPSASNADLVEDWFEQVVTFDNASTVLA